MRPTKSPTNTTKNATPADLPIFGGSSNAILAQEAQGQKELVKSDTLPTENLEACRKMIEKAGGKIGPIVVGDPLFTVVDLPKGWTKRATEHSMGSELLDEKGRVRATIFYKAAFYDRNARITPVRAIDISQDYNRRDAIVLTIMKHGNPLHALEPLVYSDKQAWDVRDKAYDIAKRWLAANGYPDWESVEAYWD